MSAASAEPQPICADRPGKSTAPCTAPAGHFQVETALADYMLQKSVGARETLVTLGETTIKYGVDSRTDVEIDLTPWLRGTSREGGTHRTVSGIGDVNLLLKHEFTDSGAALRVSALPFVKLPTARRPVGNGKVEAGFLLPIQYSIPDSALSITVSPEIDWLADSDGRGHHAAMAQVASVGWQATHKLNLSAELYQQWDWDRSKPERQSSFDAAAAYAVRDDLQIDGGINLGLSRAAADVEVYAGVAEQF